jgi:sugar phosphate permease
VEKKMKKKLIIYKTLILIFLFSIYVGVYICRSNLTVITERLLSEGLSKPNLGIIISLGTLSYSFGKLIAGLIIDKFEENAYIITIISTLLSVLFTLTFGFAREIHLYWYSNTKITEYHIILISWILNRFFQSFTWVFIKHKKRDQ